MRMKATLMICPSFSLWQVLFGLSASLDLCSLEQDILTLLSAEGTSSGFPAVASSEFKLRATVGYAPMCYYFLIIYLPSWYFTFEMINVSMDLLMFKEMNPFLCRYSLVWLIVLAKSYNNFYFIFPGMSFL